MKTALPEQIDSRPGATAFKLEFWSSAGPSPRKHRNRYYKTIYSMQTAGRKWEERGPEYWCRYWNGLNTWRSAKLGDTSVE